jgi:hypothetical protein
VYVGCAPSRRAGTGDSHLARTALARQSEPGHAFGCSRGLVQDPRTADDHWHPALLATIAMNVIGLVEGILYLTKSDADFYETYAIRRKDWF